MLKSKAVVIKWAICVILPILVVLIPLSETFTIGIRSFLALTVLIISVFATGVVAPPAVALLMPILYVIVLGTSPGAAFAAWTQPIPWMVLGSFILSFGLEKTGLIRRTALRCVIFLGGSYLAIIIGIIIAGGIVSLVITDLSAKAVLFGTFGLSICKVLKLELGNKATGGIAIASLIATLDPGTLFMHGSTNRIVPLGLAEAAGMTHPTWLGYLSHMFVPHLIFIALCTFVCLIMFKTTKEQKASFLEAKGNLSQELKAMGPMSIDEKKLIVISALLLIGVVTSEVHKIAIPWLFLLAGVVLLLPGIKIVAPPELGKCNIPFVIVVASFLSMGAVAGSVGFGPFLAGIAAPLIAGSTHLVVGGIFVFGFIINLVLTPLAAYSAFTGSVVEIAQTLNVNPLPLVYTWAITFEQIIFPFQFVPVLIIFGYGMISFKDIVLFNVAKLLISFVCILTIYIGWWYLIGIL